MLNCEYCEKPLITASQARFCSISCSGKRLADGVVTSWLNGEISGLTTNGVVKPVIKEWLRANRGDQCEICGWSEINPTTGKVPIVADHINGDWQDNRPENLRLICCNCDSLSPTYKGLNRNSGRTIKGRAVKA